MTIIEAIERSRPLGRRKDYLAIRRMSWVAGRRIQWDPKSSRWKFGNMLEPDLLAAARRELNELEHQGCLTPDTLTALDWEVVL